MEILFHEKLLSPVGGIQKSRVRSILCLYQEEYTEYTYLRNLIKRKHYLGIMMLSGSYLWGSLFWWFFLPTQNKNTLRNKRVICLWISCWEEYLLFKFTFIHVLSPHLVSQRFGDRLTNMHHKIRAKRIKNKNLEEEVICKNNWWDCSKLCNLLDWNHSLF